jgi:hypothetical protein
MNERIATVLSYIVFIIPLFAAGISVVFEGGLFTLFGLLLIVASCTGAYYAHRKETTSKYKL